jgi:hypothetical protein
VSPLSTLGASGTNQEKRAYSSRQFVIGTTIHNGRRPTEFRFMTTAGRIFCISAPTVGVNRTFYTSPLLGGIEKILGITSFKIGQIGNRSVEGFGIGNLLF